MLIHVVFIRKALPEKEKEFKESLRHFLGESFLHGSVSAICNSIFNYRNIDGSAC